MSLTKTTYSMIYSQPVNVADYGAYGDGQHDDTAAIQAAINAAGRLLPDTFPPSIQMTFTNTSRPPPVVFLPPGTYRLTDTLNLYTGMTLMGLNDIAYTVESTRLIMDTATSIPVATGLEPGGVVNLNKPILKLTRTYIPTGTLLSNSVTCTVANIGFWIVNPNGSIALRSGSGWGIGAGGLGSGGTGSAIYCNEQMIDSRIKRCNFYSIPNAAVWLDGTGQLTKGIRNVEIEECEFDTPIVDVRMDNVDAALVCSNTKFFGGSFQIYANDIAGFVNAVNCQFEFNARIKIAPATLDSFLFVGNKHYGSGGNGTALDINSAKKVTIVGNEFGLSTESTVNILGAVGGTIANNTVSNSGFNAPLITPTTNGHSGIRLVGCQNVVVEGNSVITPDAATYNNFGIFSLDGTLPSKNVFSNNFVSGAYNGAGFRGQPRRINVADGDVVSDNYTGNPDTVTPEWRVHDGFMGQLSFYRQGTTSVSSTADTPIGKLAQGVLTYHFAALSSADNSMFQVLVGRNHLGGTYSILNVIKDGVAGAGLGPHTISPGPNTVTFSISGADVRVTYSLATDPILTSLQLSGAKHNNA